MIKIDPALFSMIIFIFLISIIIGAVLFIIIKLLVGNFERKHLVDVDVYEFCGGTISRKTYNCKLVRSTLTKLQNDMLVPFPFGREQFEYLSEFIITRARDRKRAINFLQVRGKLVPFLPGYETGIITAGKDKYTWITPHIDTKDYSHEIIDRRTEEMQKEAVDKYRNLGQTKKKITWQIFVAGILLLVLIGYLIWKYAV